MNEGKSEEEMNQAVPQTPQEKLVAIKEKATSNGLWIGRIPEKTKLEFMAWAKEDYSRDYGMALKFLWDLYKGILTTPNLVLSDRIDVLAEKLVELENKLNATRFPRGRERRMLSGKVIGRGGKENEQQTSTNTSEEKEVPVEVG